MPRDFGLSHAGIMFKRQRGDGVAVLAVPANAGKADDGADIGARTRQRRDLPRDVEIGFLIAGDAGEQIIPATTLIGIVLLWVSAIFTIYTGWDYFRAGIRHLIEEDEA